MNKQALKADLLLLLTSCIWGFGFVAQRSGMEYVGPFAFNGIRFILGSLSLLPLILFRRKKGLKLKQTGGSSGSLIFNSFLAGGCLFFAVTLQQGGLMFTTAGNSGFITGLYVVLVPIVGIFWGKKTGLPTWIGAGCTLSGLYFLSAAGHLESINPGDIVTAVSAIFWALHVLLIDRLVKTTDPILLSSGQFAWCGSLSLAAALTVEPFFGGWIQAINPALYSSGLFSWHSLPALISGIGSGSISGESLRNSLVPILYGGLGSVGVAYTLQVVAQQNAPPAHATIILCLEGCFAALGGVLLLREPLGTWTFLGFCLILSGTLITQWEVVAGGFGGKKAKNG
ncbi:MAG: DMT family transporter [Spirochaetaceae bacterium]|jgi:drug/metabolite transporter (DMT)-like permease|nr:DMT family transporter [Spirochaetaceae bacterium]